MYSSDRKLISIQAEMAQSHISNNNKMLFHLPLAPIQVQSNNDEKQKSNNDTMDMVQQEQSVQSLTDIVEQQPCNINVYNDVENRHNDNSFLSEFKYQLYKINLQHGTSQQDVIEIYIKKQSWKNISSQFEVK